MTEAKNSGIKSIDFWTRTRDLRSLIGPAIKTRRSPTKQEEFTALHPTSQDSAKRVQIEDDPGAMALVIKYREWEAAEADRKRSLPKKPRKSRAKQPPSP